MVKIATGLLAFWILAACETTQMTATDPSLQSRTVAQHIDDPVRNPALVPTPLLRDNAAGGL